MEFLRTICARDGMNDRFPVLAAWGRLEKVNGDPFDIDFNEVMDKLCGTTNVLEEQ